MNPTFQQIESGPSLYSFVLQFAAVYLVPTIGWVAVDTRLELQDSLASDLIAYAFIGAVTAALAFMAARIAPSSVIEGTWVWVFPTVLELVGIGWDLYLFGGSTLKGFFLSPPPGQGEGGWVLVLLTLPTWGCCVYSFVMWRLRRSQLPATAA
jgi:hypothetical protein